MTGRAAVENLLRPRLRVMQVMWILFFCFICMLGVILQLAQVSFNFEEVFRANDLIVVASLILASIATLGSLVIVGVFRRKAIRQKWNREEFLKDLESARGRYGHKIYSSNFMATAQTFSEEQLTILRVFERSLVPFVFQLVLNECVALSGFVVGFTKFNSAFYICFAVVAAILMIRVFPTFKSLV